VEQSLLENSNNNNNNNNNESTCNETIKQPNQPNQSNILFTTCRANWNDRIRWQRNSTNSNQHNHTTDAVVISSSRPE